MNALFARTAVPQVAATKIDKYIEIVSSTNLRINGMAPATQLSIQAVLNERYTKVGITHVNTMADLEALVAKKPDLVVLGMRLILLDETVSFNASPKVWISAYLKRHGIAFTGSEAQALALDTNKHIAKQKVIDAGLQSAAYAITTIANPTVTQNLRFPLFVKPTNRSGSIGIDEMSVVHTHAQLQAKVNSIHKAHASDVIIEEYLPGREFSVAVVRRNFSQNLLAMPVEFKSLADSNGNTFLSQTVRAAGQEKLHAVTDLALKKALNALAIGAFKALGARDYGRIDIRLDADGAPSFIEANLMPGLSSQGYLLHCFAINNRSTYQDMILSIVSLALERKPMIARA